MVPLNKEIYDWDQDAAWNSGSRNSFIPNLLSERGHWVIDFEFESPGPSKWARRHEFSEAY